MSARRALSEPTENLDVVSPSFARRGLPAAEIVDDVLFSVTAANTSRAIDSAVSFEPEEPLSSTRVLPKVTEPVRRNTATVRRNMLNAVAALTVGAALIVPNALSTVRASEPVNNLSAPAAMDTLISRDAERPELAEPVTEAKAREAEAERQAEEARLAEEARQAEEARLAEEARAAEEARQAEEARVAEEARAAEEARLAEEAAAAANANSYVPEATAPGAGYAPRCSGAGSRPAASFWLGKCQRPGRSRFRLGPGRQALHLGWHRPGRLRLLGPDGGLLRIGRHQHSAHHLRDHGSWPGGQRRPDSTGRHHHFVWRWPCRDVHRQRHDRALAGLQHWCADQPTQLAEHRHHSTLRLSVAWQLLRWLLIGRSPARSLLRWTTKPAPG